MISDDPFLKSLCGTLLAESEYPAALESLQEELAQVSLMSSSNTWAYHRDDPFDSYFYKCKVGKIDHLSQDASHAEHIINKLRGSNHYDYLVFKIPSQNISWVHALELSGAITLDISLHLVQPRLSTASGFGDDINVLPYTKSQEAEIIKLAKSFTHGRFFTDPHIEESGELVYKTWIENALNGKVADQTYVAMHKDTNCGFISLKKNMLGRKHYTSVILIAKEPRCAVKGMGQKLLAYAMSQSQDTLGLALNTQVTNLPALKAYISAGYKPFFSETVMGLKVLR